MQSQVRRNIFDVYEPPATGLEKAATGGGLNPLVQSAYLEASDDSDELSVRSIINSYHEGDPTKPSWVRKYMKAVLRSIKSEEENLFDNIL